MQLSRCKTVRPALAREDGKITFIRFGGARAPTTKVARCLFATVQIFGAHKVSLAREFLSLMMSAWPSRGVMEANFLPVDLPDSASLVLYPTLLLNGWSSNNQ